MPFYRRRRYYGRKALKYSNETMSCTISLDNNGETGTHTQSPVSVVPVTTVLGTRKLKNFLLQIMPLYTKIGEDVQNAANIAWALVFVPEGTDPSRIAMGAGQTTSFYEPNQNVIMSGVADSSRVYQFRSRLARNLNAGDQVALILYDLTSKPDDEDVSTGVAFTLNYAIGY